MTRRLSSVALAILGSALLPAPVGAQPALINGLGGPAGYGTSCMSHSDDGSSPIVSLATTFPAGLRFFDRTHTNVYVNINGNITFSGPQACYTPNAFPIANQPMIAPYWADVDVRPFLRNNILGRVCDGPEGMTTCPPTTATCRSPANNAVWWYTEPGRMIVTWDRVGFYQCRDANGQRMSFQLILTAVPSCGGSAGTDFDVEFRYNRCEWETGDASGGTGGFGGTEAQAGFDAGNLMNFVEIMGSRNAGIARRLCDMSNVGLPGIWQFQIRGGAVICPDAGMACTLPGLMGACAMGRTNCMGGGTTCVQQVFSEPERCDNVDNDCNGMTDEGDPRMLCSPGFACRAGACVEDCFESACPTGLVCVAPGVCVESGCETVTCPEGQRCVAGVCVAACSGVVCPVGETCTAGRCVNQCLGLTCDACTTCDDGACVERCDISGMCPAGETCEADGSCAETACIGVTCSAGTHCAGGACVDSCTGVSCPFGQECLVGVCVAVEIPDGGPGFDGGPRPDGGGVIMDPDSGVVMGIDGGPPDAGRGRPLPSAAGCACSVPGPRRAPGALSLVLLVVGLVLRRGRTR